MKRATRLLGGILQALAALGLLAILPSRANAVVCCSSVWDCMATVASQGLTCVVQIHIAALHVLIEKVQRERADKRQAFYERMAAAEQEAAEKLRDEQRKADKAVNDLEQASAESRKMIQEDGIQLQLALQKPLSQQSTTSATPQQPSSSTTKNTTAAPRSGAVIRQSPGTAPAPAQNPPPQAYSAMVNQAALRELANDNSLSSMHKQIEEEHRRGAEARRRLLEQKEKAKKAMEQSQTAAGRVFEDSFLARIDQLLRSLIEALNNPLRTPKILEAAVGILDGIIAGYDNEVTPAVDKDSAVKRAGIVAAQRPAAEAQKHAETARIILVEMRRSARLKTVAERRQALTQLNATVSSAASARVESMVYLQASEQMRSAMKKSSADLRLLRPEVQRLKSAPAPDLKPIRASVGQSFDQFFKGKTPAEARKTRDALLAEARRRFVGDPKLLASVETLIFNEAKARGVF
jgi:hypothetical protein